MSNPTRASRPATYQGLLFAGLILLAGVMSGTVVVILGPQGTITALLFVFAGILCWAKPTLYIQGLLVVAIALPAGFTTTQIFSIEVGEYNVLYIDVLFGFVVLRWILNQIGTRARPLTGGVVARRLSTLIAVLLIYTVFALFRGLLEYGRFNQSIYAARPIFYYLIILIAFDYLQTQQDIERLSKNFLVGLGLYSLFVISYFLVPTGHPLSAAQELNNWAYANRIGFSNGAYLLLGIPMALWLLVDRRVVMPARIWLFFTLSVFFTVSILSMSRTIAGLLVLPIILSYFVNSRFNLTRPSVLSLRLLLIAVLAAISIFIAINQIMPLLLGESSQYTLETFVQRFDLASADAYESHVVPRRVMLDTAWSLILQNPILGYGFGYQFELAGWQREVDFVDNSYFTAWLRLGIVGLLLLLGLILLLFQSARRMMHRALLKDSPYVRAFFVSFVGGGISLLILSLNTSWLVTSSGVIPLLIIAGAIIGFSTQNEANER